MAFFTHSILAANAAIAADGDEVIDLPVNPLSVILLNISPLNETSTITTYSLIEGLLAAVTSLRVTHRGAAVVDGNGVDLAALAMLYHGVPIWQSNASETDNERRSLVLPILFGRRAYMANEAFPETKKGELLLNITWDIAAAAFDGLRRSVETIELPGASPEFVQKVTTLAQTFAAAGQNEIDMPIGNVLRAILLWGTAGFTGAAPAPTLGRLELLANNLQTHFSATDWEVLRGAHGLGGVRFPADFGHIHSGTYTTTVAGDSRQAMMETGMDDNYALMNLDPTKDDEYSLATEGMSRVHVRSEAEGAAAVRLLPIERVPASRFTTV